VKWSDCLKGEKNGILREWKKGKTYRELLGGKEKDNITEDKGKR
jgi:hypothetical protein